MRIKDTGFFLSPYSHIREKGDAAQTEAAAKSGKDTFQKNVNQAVRADKIELSSQQGESSGRLAGSLKNSICEGLGRSTDTARLQYLKNAVANGRYFVDSGTLAEALLFDE